MLGIATLATVTLGCGGGGGGGTTAATSTGGGGGGGNVVTPRTFTFPTFASNSKLTVVANFQTADESPNITGTLTATLADFAGTTPRIVSRAEEPSARSADVNPCGYGDTCALSAFAGDTFNAQSTAQPAVRKRFQELAEGATEDFIIVPAGFKTVTGQKILAPNETLHCTIFAEVVNNAPIIDRTKALAIAQAFDSNNPQRPGSGIYDQVRAVFGSEWNQNPVGGNDGDTKIVLFFFSSATGGSGLYGYTSPADADPNGGGLSNKGEIIYINGEKSTYQTLATISHEFQHLINQNEKVSQQGLNPSGATDENLTINEGLSELSEEICGYTLQSGNDLLALFINDYLKKPQDHSFFNFYAAGNGYGQGYLFLKFVHDNYGDQMIRDICTNPGVGLANLNAKLPLGFAETFRRWTVANYATNLTGTPSLYTYPSGFRTNGNYPAGQLTGVATQSMSNNQENSSGAIKAWSTRYMVLDGDPGVGLSAQILGAQGSPFGVLFEQISGTLTSFQQ